MPRILRSDNAITMDSLCQPDPDTRLAAPKVRNRLFQWADSTISLSLLLQQSIRFSIRIHFLKSSRSIDRQLDGIHPCTSIQLASSVG